MKIEYIIKRFLLIVLITISFLYFILYNTIPFDNDWVLLQLSTFLIAIIGVYIGCSSPTIKKVIWVTIICQILNHIILLNSSMPTMSGDGENYVFVAKKIAAYPNLYEGFKAFLNGISGSYYYELSDLGYVSILSTLYFLFDETLGNYIDIILKICANTATVYYVYKIFIKFIDHENKRYYGLLAGLIFGVGVFPAYLAYGILKESYFIFAIILSIYWLYKLSEKFSFKNLLIFAICVFWTYMYRGIMPLYFIAAYAMYIYLRNKKAMQVQLVVVSMFVLSVVSMSLLVTLLPQLETSFAARTEKYDSSLIGFIMNVTGPFLSPIPAINKFNVNSNLCIFSYSVMNITFAYFALLGIYNTLKNGITSLYPILFALLLNSIMVILTAYAINARYTYIVAPLYYSFVPFGLKYYRSKSLLLYLIAIVGLIYIYNVR